MAYIRAFGSRAYALKPSTTHNKLDAKTLLGTIVGCAAGGHAFRVKSAATGIILIRRDVVANETVPVTPVHPSALPVSLFLPEGCSIDTATSSTHRDEGGGGDVPGNDGQGTDVPAAGMGREVPGDDMPGADTTDSAGAATPGAVGLRDDGPPGNGYFLRHRVASDPPTASALTVLAPVPPTPAPLNSMTVADAVSHTEWCAAPPLTRADALNRRDAHLWQREMDEEMASLRAARS